MENEDRLDAIYYPDCYVEDRRTFAAMALYFDSVHFVSPSDSAVDPIKYTDHLKKLPDSISVCGIGDFSTDKARAEMEHLRNLYRFILETRPLLGSIVYYHGNLWGTQIGRITQKLTAGELTSDELVRFIKGDTPESQAFRDFRSRIPVGVPEMILRVMPTARFLAEKQGFILISDKKDCPAPILQPLQTSSKDLSSSLAQEIIVNFVFLCPLFFG